MNYPVSAQAGNGFSYIGIPGTQACWNPYACKLKVEGTGSVSIQPDQAEVSLGVVTENRLLKAAQEENTTQMTSVINTLKAMGIPPRDIQTQSYGISPVYDYPEGNQVLRGYRVEHILKVIVRNTGSLGAIIDSAVQSGANQVSGIIFTVSKPELYYQQALKAAIDDAIAKAATLAEKLNIKVSSVPVQITELGTEAPPIPLMYQSAAPATSIQVGEIEIKARIEAIFSYCL